MGRRKGICTLCGKGGKLSFEHVPPRASGNVPGVLMFGLHDWLARDQGTGEMSGGVPQPAGTGVIGACEPCNRFMGGEYVPAFIRFTDAGREMLGQLADPSPYDARPKPTYLHVAFNELDRLAVAKQIVAMLLMTSGRAVAERNPELARFVLDPEARGLPDRYRLFLALSPGPMARSTGVVGHLNTVTGQTRVVSELVYPPFGYAMTFNGTAAYEAGEITDWTLAAKGERVTVPLGLPLGFAHTALPADLRSRAQIHAEADSSAQRRPRSSPPQPAQKTGTILVAKPGVEADAKAVGELLRDVEEARGKQAPK